ncbi:MAG: oligopeptide/dipeptide ABC transporter ATP-binding protein, partial [Phycisphaerae bacterium]
TNAMSILFITHDLGVVAQIADRVCVMYAGRMVEEAAVGELFDRPLHPYTRGLLRSLPRMGTKRDRLQVIPGNVPNPLRFPDGCRFHPRCDLTRRRAEDGERQRHALHGPGDAVEVLARCVEPGDQPGGAPGLREVRPGHWVACWEVEGYDASPGRSEES